MGTPHRVIETEVFYFDQLSDKAKEKARDWWRDCEASDPSWAQERRESLEGFCKVMPLKRPFWEYDSCSYHVGAAFDSDECVGKFKGSRSIGHLLTYYSGVLRVPKVYEINGKKRTSKVLFEETDCPFTGYCADEALLDPIREYLKKPDMDLTFKELMQKCLDSWGYDCMKDMQWLLSDGQVDETILANEYEFDAEGTRV